MGNRLTELLLQKGYQVVHLGRGKKNGVVPSYLWDVNAGTIDAAALEGVEAVIHLAGAGVADKRWSGKRKEEILNSRTQSSRLLFNFLNNNSHSVKTFVSASAIGIYGVTDQHSIFTEDHPPAHDFLARVVRDWEEEVDQIASLGIRVSKLRIGMVLSDRGGALTKMVAFVRWGIGAPLGTGRQDVSWIHIDDLCAMFIHVIENEKCIGAYNAVTHWASNREVTEEIAKRLRRPLWLPAVPGFALKIILGEMADIVLGGSKVSSEKIRSKGFVFRFSDLGGALNDLL